VDVVADFILRREDEDPAAVAARCMFGRQRGIHFFQSLIDWTV